MVRRNAIAVKVNRDVANEIGSSSRSLYFCQTVVSGGTNSPAWTRGTTSGACDLSMAASVVDGSLLLTYPMAAGLHQLEKGHKAVVFPRPGCMGFGGPGTLPGPKRTSLP